MIVRILAVALLAAAAVAASVSYPDAKRYAEIRSM
ncbi:MAG: DUF6893 family small protein [Mycobacteriales bacterium]